MISTLTGPTLQQRAYHSLGLYSKSPSPDIIGVKWKSQTSGTAWRKVLLSELKQTSADLIFDILAFVSLYSSWGVFMHCIVEVDAINQGIQNNSFLALHLLQPGHAWTLLHTLHTIAKHIYVEIYTCLHAIARIVVCTDFRIHCHAMHSAVVYPEQNLHQWKT